MSKKLLTILGVCAGLSSVNAQVLTQARLGVDNSRSNAKIDLHQATPIMRQHPEANAAREGVNQVLIGSSYNIYTALLSESTCLTYNDDLNTVMFTHRQNSNFPGGSGIIQTTYSTDGGMTWDANDYNLLTDQAYLCRYPSGVIYNPAGNTEPDSAFAVISGPITSGAGWDANYFNSIQFNGDNLTESYLNNDSTGVDFQHMARIHMIATQDGKVRVIGDSADWNDTASPWETFTSIMNTATFNETTKAFDWEKTYFNTDFMNAPSDNSFVGVPSGYQAWSLDGTVGYFVQLGIPEGSTGNDRALLPIVYKTTDSGANWAVQPRMDWTTLSEVTSRIYPTTSLSTPRPFFTTSNGFDMTVDSEGELHIACEIASQWSDDADSLLYSATPAEFVAYLYDVHTDGSGWDAFVIDSIYTDAFTNADLGDLDIDCRLQISRNEDASKIFYSWMTSDVAWTTVNEIPDVYAKGYDVATGNETEAVNFTIGTDYEGYNFFIYLSDMSISDNGTYTLPITVSLPTSNDLSPMDHYYMTGVEFMEADFVADVSVENLPAAVESMTIYPNPAKNVVNINMNMLQSVNADLSIVNLIGQTVYNTNLDLSNGLNTTTINVENLNAGVYFIKTSINNETTVSRIVVE